MSSLLRPAAAVLLVGVLAPAARPHFNILLPGAATARKGEAVTFLYRFGHPFEHELFDAPPPARVFALAPDGKRIDLGKALEKTKVPAGGKEGVTVTAYRFRFTPEQRGDYTFILQTPPIWLEGDKEFVQDTVKVVLHVQAQKGWDADPGRQFKIMPLTRPYGLQPGVVFRAQVLAPPEGVAPGGTEFLDKGKPLAGTLVEIERLNEARPAKLPPDEFRTLTAKTDPGGVVTASLPEPGWWAITAQRDAGRREYKGKAYPVRQRATLWVWVDQKITGK
jgi:cobalt/nickel transport protein